MGLRGLGVGHTVPDLQISTLFVTRFFSTCRLEAVDRDLAFADRDYTGVPRIEQQCGRGGEGREKEGKGAQTPGDRVSEPDQLSSGSFTRAYRSPVTLIPCSPPPDTSPLSRTLRPNPHSPTLPTGALFLPFPFSYVMPHPAKKKALEAASALLEKKRKEKNDLADHLRL